MCYFPAYKTSKQHYTYFLHEVGPQPDGSWELNHYITSSIDLLRLCLLNWVDFGSILKWSKMHVESGNLADIQQTLQAQVNSWDTVYNHNWIVVIDIYHPISQNESLHSHIVVVHISIFNGVFHVLPSHGSEGLNLHFGVALLQCRKKNNVFNITKQCRYLGELGGTPLHHASLHGRMDVLKACKRKTSVWCCSILCFIVVTLLCFRCVQKMFQPC